LHGSAELSRSQRFSLSLEAGKAKSELRTAPLWRKGE
jgi:hypothetical protein